jgi:hypothetical protein
MEGPSNTRNRIQSACFNSHSIRSEKPDGQRKSEGVKIGVRLNLDEVQ